MSTQELQIEIALLKTQEAGRMIVTVQMKAQNDRDKYGEWQADWSKALEECHVDFAEKHAALVNLIANKTRS